MREMLTKKEKEMPDLSFYPEHFLIKNAFDNPVAFGQQHQKDIQRYIGIADLSLSSFNDVRTDIEESLTSSDPWDRYWGLIVCSTLIVTAPWWPIKLTIFLSPVLCTLIFALKVLLPAEPIGKFLAASSEQSALFIHQPPKILGFSGPLSINNPALVA